MSPSARKDASLMRAQEKELKRSRGAMSCAECRRLKLKCDKTVPCSSCKRRGCSAICPNGSLITGQGTRFVLADTEKLHHKISDMSERIRQLEDALAILHTAAGSSSGSGEGGSGGGGEGGTGEPHPLLQPELLKIKSSIDLHSAAGSGSGGPDAAGGDDEEEESQYVDAFGTLAICDDGGSTFYGRSAGHESLLIGENQDPELPGPSQRRDSIGRLAPNPGHHLSLPPAVLRASTSFPFPLTQMSTTSIGGSGAHAALLSNGHDSHLPEPPPDADSLSAFLPPWPEAWRLCELYLDQAPWFFGAVTRAQIVDELLPAWYPEAAPSPHSGGREGPHHQQCRQKQQQPQQPQPQPQQQPQPQPSAHELALLFVVLCFGAVTDMNLPAPPDNADAEHWFALARAALNVEPLLERPGSVAAVQTLSLMAIYKGMCAGAHSIESTWALMGMATRMAQSIGLHHDTARWGLSTAEVQKRRALFWELFITDCWQSLATGRLATFSLPFVDCELPNDPDNMLADDGTIIPSFPAWKARFGSECVAAVVQGVLTSRPPKYSTILELDRRVRDMPLPLYAQKPPQKGVGLIQTMSHFMPNNYRLLTLLYIHRGYFSIAVQNHPQDPLKSHYAPSFLAGYRSACELIGSIKAQFSYSPAQIARFWVLWTHSFSASTMLASVVMHCPTSKVASAAFMELRMACDLFERAAPFGGRAQNFLPIVQRMAMKAHQTYIEVHSGIAPAVTPDLFAPSKTAKNELDIFSGRTHTVATRTTTTAAAAAAAARARGGPRAQRVGSQASDDSVGSPTAGTGTGTTGAGAGTGLAPLAAAFAGVHPMLIDQLQRFDGQLTAQIRDAYYDAPDALAVQHLERQHQQHQQHQLQQRHQQQEQEQQQQQQRHQEQQQQQQQQQYAAQTRAGRGSPSLSQSSNGSSAGRGGQLPLQLTVPDMPYTTAPMAAGYAGRHADVEMANGTQQQHHHHFRVYSGAPHQLQNDASQQQQQQQQQQAQLPPPSPYATNPAPAPYWPPPGMGFATPPGAGMYYPGEPPTYSMAAAAAAVAAPPALHSFAPQYPPQYLDRELEADPRLQEGWTTFMQSVGSPPRIFD